jgi:hypothetical protein
LLQANLAIVRRVTPIDDREIAAWLEAFAACVRARDLAGGRALFDPAAAGFGTVADRYAGIDDLADTQWSQVWSRTEEFGFDGIERHWSDSTLCAVAASWRSVGTEHGERRTRTGRAGGRRWYSDAPRAVWSPCTRTSR